MCRQKNGITFYVFYYKYIILTVYGWRTSMIKTEHFTLGIPQDIASALTAAMSSGKYSSRDEILLEALKLWQEHHDLFGLSDADIGMLWDEGMASGDGRFSSIHQLIDEANVTKPR
jgi:antitoxin ParD1/3/4